MFRRLYDKKVSATGLAIFRITYTLVLLAEILQFYYFRHLIFDRIPFIEQSEINFSIPIIIWGISVLFVLIGLFTRTATIINYLLSLILIGSITTYEYHMFYAYMGINFLLIFLPISRNISIDRLLLKYKYSTTRFNYNPPTKVTVLAYYMPVLIGVAFVYFDSIFFKLSSEFWMKGLGMWLPTSIPPIILNDLQFLLNQEYLMYFLGYLTIAFEAIFLFTFFRKRWRVPLLIIGIGLHVGILICYPIPWFALGMCSIYILLIPISFWRFLSNQIKLNKPVLQFYYDAECPLCNRTKITIEHFDIRKAILFKTVQFDAENQPLLQGISKNELLENIYSIKNGKVYKGVDTYIQVLSSIIYLKPLSWFIRIQGIYHIAKCIYSFVAKNRDTERCTEENCGYTPPILPSNEDNIKILQSYTIKDLKVNLLTFSILITILLQSIITYNSGINKNVRSYLSIEHNRLNKFIEKKSEGINNITKTLFGLTHHAVFMDDHFKDYNHVIAVTYIDNKGKEIWLPIIQPKGIVGDYLIGSVYCKWNYRVNSSLINQDNLKNGIRDFSAFWAHKNNVDLNDATFIIKVKKIETPTKWEKDFLKNQMEQPWKNVGKANWTNKEFFIDIPIIEEL
ncbi:DCC1-like thiol-disulfide oxidoreductase family protein [Empedobacter sp. GD03644]|uniref:DCC1-like thiol-disulfide oxidoreductase family protein n=1 Tax=Empedobacter sp. GD03644 TaxID=2975358 RepID=UPI00244A56C9|nr:DCC1-like thiol-disulfide oxidoreductase family protein [Empedobacter sp. GD03644]MDH2206328.1 DCC1-like thiol-disulfide oxidoreductase family protein [Empedobacter sp. GD03644]